MSRFQISLVLILVFMVSGMALAQEETEVDPYAWRLASDINLTQTQNAYSDNWAGDETGTVSWTFTFNFLAERQINSLLNSRSTARMSFGQTHNQDGETEHWNRPEKSTDLIDMESMLRFTMHAWVDPFVAGRLQSQFMDRRAGDAEWFNPLTLTETAGISRTFINDDTREWYARLGFGSRQQIDRIALIDTLGNRDSKTTYDAGFEFVSELITPLVPERLNMTGKITIFQAVAYSESDELEGAENADYWKSPDINLETIFTANITRYVMVNLYAQLLYDKEIDKGGRFKETLSLGLTYTLF